MVKNKQIISVLTATILGLILGLISLYFLYNGQILIAFILQITALIFDLLDGYLARKWQIESKIGAFLDSTSDISLYLLFPMFMLHQAYPRIQIIYIAIFIILGITRLIRFTLQGLQREDKSLYYRGMPVFYSLLFLTAIRLYTFPIFLVDATLIILAILMISQIPFKKPHLKIMGILLIIYLVNLFL